MSTEVAIFQMDREKSPQSLPSARSFLFALFLSQKHETADAAHNHKRHQLIDFDFNLNS